MKPHKWAKEIKAWADGAEIQFKDSHDRNEWLDCADNEPTWETVDFLEYRIKPQPKEPQAECRFKKWEKEVKHFLAGGKVKAINLGISGLKGTVKHLAAFDDPNYIFEIEKESQYLYVYNGKGKTKISINKFPEMITLINGDYEAIPYLGKIKLEVDDEN